MTSGIYSITNTVDGKIYIGSGLDIRNRWNNHQKCLRANAHANPHLQHAWNTYGEAAFVFAVVEECSREETLLREQVLLDQLFATRPRHEIYNVARHADAPTRGSKASMLTSLKRSVALQGKKRSAETRARMSVAQRGRIITEEHRQRISASVSGHKHRMWGKRVSDECRFKIRDSNLGLQRSEETRRRISASKSGLNHPCWGKHIPVAVLQKRIKTRKLNKIVRLWREADLGR